MHVYYYKKKKNLNVLDSWHIYCFIVHSVCLFLSLLLKKKKKKTECLGFLAYLLFYCTFCISISFFIKKKTNCPGFLAYWHIYCFIVHFACLFFSLLKKTDCLGFLAYLLFYCIFCMSTSFFI